MYGDKVATIEHGEKQFTITVFENLYDKIMTSDKSTEMKQIRKELRNRKI